MLERKVLSGSTEIELEAVGQCSWKRVEVLRGSSRRQRTPFLTWSAPLTVKHGEISGHGLRRGLFSPETPPRDGHDSWLVRSGRR